jgi:hypothetical protein
MESASRTKKLNLYFTESVWKALLHRALDEGSSASKIITRLLERFAENPQLLPETHNKPRLSPISLESGVPATVRVPIPVYEQARQLTAESVSLSYLCEALVRGYLGISEADGTRTTHQIEGESEINPHGREGTKIRAMPEGSWRFAPVDKPFVIDLNTSKQDTA